MKNQNISGTIGAETRYDC
ncbi:hypothetical protein RDI58_017651 [Solanum bulbocastanum]|uniref:Uncharacterized protein n=1 Tax=Solanum bulbocastanum TaxID=147425 RepID=A0AAN8Y9E1_SOLBU